ncbi:hypothetical protein C0J52_00553 [Blattella germanica]|nr:hypothetical protein C0J52_00553 [Blattella germanica]
MLAVHPFLQPDYVYNRLQTSLYLASSYFITSVIVTSFLAINFSGYGVKSEDTITKSLVKTSKEACMYLSMNEEGSGSGSIVNGVFELSEVPLHENSPAIM